VIKFLDGPAKDVILQLHRAPLILRVVRDKQGQWDALDQLGDSPKPGEVVYLYRAVTVPRSMHLSMADRKKSGWFYSADYRYLDDQPAKIHTWSNWEWDKWCNDNKDRLMELFVAETGYKGSVE
jgi:hypothetical protein